MIYASAQKEADNRLRISIERDFNYWDVNPRLNLKKNAELVKTTRVQFKYILLSHLTIVGFIHAGRRADFFTYVDYES